MSKVSDNKIKVTTYSTTSTRSYKAYLGYIPSMLSSFNWNLTPKVTITDWRENSKLKLEIKKLSKGIYLVTLQGDSYYEIYSDLDEAINPVVTFVANNFLPKEKLNVNNP